MLKLIRANVGIRPRFYDNKTESGLLYIPEDSIRRANQGTVIYTGPHCKLVTLGDYVLFSGHSGTTVRTDGGVVIILSEEFLTCVIKEEVEKVPGLFMQDKNGYFDATYEGVIEMLNRAHDVLEVRDIRK